MKRRNKSIPIDEIKKEIKENKLITIEEIKEEIKEEKIKEEKIKIPKFEIKTIEKRKWEIGKITFLLLGISFLVISVILGELFISILAIFILFAELVYHREETKLRNIRLSRIDNRINFKVLLGNHIVLFTHRENDIVNIIGKTKVGSLQENVRIREKNLSYMIDTKKPSLIWGGMRLYLIDCENSQQYTFKENEKVINKEVINDFVYRESLYRLSKNVHRGNMETKAILLGFLIGFGFIGLILMILINFGVI